MKSWTLLLDGDVLAYRITAACEREIHWGGDDWSLHVHQDEVRAQVDSSIKRMRTELEDLGFPVEDVRVFLSDRHTFRHEFNPDYKANRIGQRKPCSLLETRKFLTEAYGAEVWDNIEADDAISITATEPGHGPCIVVSVDKDFRTIPETWVWDPWSNDRWPPAFTTAEEAERNLAIQVLAGDRVDNYKGIPGIGPKRASDWLKKHSVSWDSIVKCYESKGLTEEDAWNNAVLAYLLRWGDYNRETGCVDLTGSVPPAPPISPVGRAR